MDIDEAAQEIARGSSFLEERVAPIPLRALARAVLERGKRIKELEADRNHWMEQARIGQEFLRQAHALLKGNGDEPA